MAASITAHLQIFKRPQLPHFTTDFDETGFKIHLGSSMKNQYLSTTVFYDNQHEEKENLNFSS